MNASTDWPRPITADEARAVDRYAIETLGLPGLVLMENAAINTASVVLDLLGDTAELDRDAFRVGVLCGGGNNGGDGYAIARHLLGFGIDVELFAAKPVDQLAGDALVNARACVRLGVRPDACRDAAEASRCAERWSAYHLLVDALLGTGFKGEVRHDLAGVIQTLNRIASGSNPGPQVLAVDLPSGLDADTGQPAESTVRADTTVTFVAPKAGFNGPAAAAVLGRVVVADIGLPDAAVRAALGV